ncbi:MAG: GAF domain-containing protein [Polyangiaceae bacterium]|nr:GAF domain-containing protein [Polyangiaceae bacterium]
MYRPVTAHQQWLTAAVASLNGVAGTIHVERNKDLYLTAAVNIPPPVIAVVGHVVRGKGMAGLAQVRKVPVQTCDLQNDSSGDIRPGAKAVDAQAAIAVPVLDAEQNVVAVVGFAWGRPGELDSPLQKLINNKVSEFGALLQSGGPGEIDDSLSMPPPIDRADEPSGRS